VGRWRRWGVTLGASASTAECGASAVEESLRVVPPRSSVHRARPNPVLFDVRPRRLRDQPASAAGFDRLRPRRRQGVDQHRATQTDRHLLYEPTRRRPASGSPPCSAARLQARAILKGGLGAGPMPGCRSRKSALPSIGLEIYKNLSLRHRAADVQAGDIIFRRRRRPRRGLRHPLRNRRNPPELRRREKVLNRIGEGEPLGEIGLFARDRARDRPAAGTSTPRDQGRAARVACGTAPSWPSSCSRPLEPRRRTDQERAQAPSVR